MSRLTAVICTRNRYQEVLRCLRSLQDQTRPVDEVLIVDASDEDYLGPIVAGLFGSAFQDLRVLPSERGLTRQRNVGVSHSTGDLVFFFDDDVVLHAEYIERVAKVLDSPDGKRFGGGMGQIQGVTKQSGVHFVLARLFYLGEVFGTGRFKPSGFPSLPHGRSSFQETECMSGGLACYRREVLREFSFDEALNDYAYMEDDDFAYRVSRRYPLFYEPAAVLEHRHAGGGRMNRRVLSKMLVRNHRYLFRKNLPHTWRHRWAHGLSLAGIVLQCGFELNPQALVGAVQGIFARTRE